MVSFYQPIRDPIAQHARPLIALLEKKIEDEFGLTVQIGFEKEFFPIFSGAGIQKGKRFYNRHLDDMESIRQEQYDKTAAALGKERTSPVVQSYCVETDKFTSEFQTEHTTPSRAVERIDAHTQLLESQTGSWHRAAPQGQKPEQILNSALKAKSKVKLKSVNFSPHQFIVYEGDRSTVIAGLHVNISLWDKGGRNLMFGEHDKIPLVNAIRERLYTYAHSDMLLIAPDQSACRRLNGYPATYAKEFFCGHRVPGDQEMRVRKKVTDPEECRLEFRTPASNARHDLAVLMTLMAVYQGLQKKQPPPTVESETREVHTPAKLLARFDRSSQLFKDLMALVASQAPAMQSHVHQLKPEITKGARSNSLHQPTLIELQPRQEKGR
jgi:hypothetical protein